MGREELARDQKVQQATTTGTASRKIKNYTELRAFVRDTLRNEHPEWIGRE